MTTLVTTYFLALLWYRFSDYLQKFMGFGEDDSEFFVVFYGLRPPSFKLDNPLFNPEGTEKVPNIDRLLYASDEWNMPESMPAEPEIHERLITIMYYALTTLSTVGYGDYSPCSIAEKIIGSVIQIFGVTFFSILMNNFIDVVLSMRTQNFNDNEDKLGSWFLLIKKIRNQPFTGALDIPIELRERIEAHFRYFWENDRTAVLLTRKSYFDSIPFKIQEHIMCKFLF